MMTAEIQSTSSHGDQDGDRDDHGQEQLREIAGEVPVQGVDAPDGQGGQITGAGHRPCLSGPRRATRSTSAARIMRLDPGRAAVGRHLGDPRHQGPQDDHAQQELQRDAAAAARSLPPTKAPATMVASSQAWAISSSARSRAEQHRRRQIDPGRAAPPQQPPDRPPSRRHHRCVPGRRRSPDGVKTAGSARRPSVGVTAYAAAAAPAGRASRGLDEKRRAR